jgi:hypothetical protein
MDIQCNNCQSYLNIREVVTRCTECKELIKPKIKNMKATLDNFLVKWDGNNPLWKELIEWLNKDINNNLFSGDMEERHYGRIEGKIRCRELHRLIDATNTPIITLEQWKELLTKTEKMNNFKNGDKVFVAPYGWCEFIKYGVEGLCVVRNGFKSLDVDFPLVSFTEYTLQGFTQERPFEPVVGQMYYFWDDNMLAAKRVICGFYKGYGSVDFPYSVQHSSISINYQHISDKNPLI